MGLAVIGPNERFYRFDDYRLDTLKHQLIKKGVYIPLRGRPFQILQYLVQNSGQVVTRHELLASVWQGTHVTDKTIDVNITKIRKILGDQPERPKYILTVAGAGYK